MPRGLSRSPLDARSTRYLREEETDAALAGPDPLAIRAAACQWISQLCPWDIYATLTYDPKRAGYPLDARGQERLPPGDFACARHFARWVDACALRAQREVLGIGALESTKLGWPHFHVVLSMAGCDPDEFRSISEEWYRPHGFVALNRFPPSDTEAVAAYLAKYFTKESADIHVRGELPYKVLPGQRWLTGLRVERSKQSG